MANPVRVAYLLVLLGLVVAGLLLVDASWWAAALIGVVVTLPIAVADIVATRRRTRRTTGDPA
jgi:hypothetical protein